MTPNLINALLALLVILATGCQTYSHKRVVYNEDGKKQMVEYTRTRGVAVDSQAAKIESRTETSREGNYVRQVGFEDVQAFSDEETIGKITDSIDNLGEGLIKAISP
jgi:hypothetical protein